MAFPSKSRYLYTPTDMARSVSTDSNLVLNDAAMPRNDGFMQFEAAGKKEPADVDNEKSCSSSDISLAGMSDDEDPQDDYLEITKTICNMVDEVFTGTDDASGEALNEDSANVILTLLEEEDEMRMHVREANKKKRSKTSKKR